MTKTHSAYNCSFVAKVAMAVSNIATPKNGHQLEKSLPFNIFIASEAPIFK